MVIRSTIQGILYVNGYINKFPSYLKIISFYLFTFTTSS